MVRDTRQFSKSIFFSEVRSDLDFNLDWLILWLCIWPFAKENVLTRICNVKRSSRMFFINNCISWFTFDFGHIFMGNRIFIKMETTSLQSILVVGTLVVVFKWYSGILNINVTLLSTFHNPPRSNISTCLCSGKGINSVQNIFWPLKVISIVVDNNYWYWIS